MEASHRGLGYPCAPAKIEGTGRAGNLGKCGVASNPSIRVRLSHIISLQMRATKAALQTIQMTHTEREINGELLRKLQGDRALQERVR